MLGERSSEVISIFVLPKRLGTGGRGKDNGHCFRRGAGVFQQGPCGNGLELVPDSAARRVRPARSTLMAFPSRPREYPRGVEIDET